jgi:transcriptional regulator with XRE-family HTH domain
MSDTTDSRAAVFARRVRELREERGWSQDALGRRVGLKQSRMAAIEANGSVTLDQAAAFAAALAVPLEALLYNEAATKAMQVQRLMQISRAVDQMRDEVSRLIGEITAEIPGRLGPPGTVVTADRIEHLGE